MRILFRADGGVEQGTGHVMRCLTLAAELSRHGHDVHLMMAPCDVEWLAETVRMSGVTVHTCEADGLPRDLILRIGPDWVVVDSYRIDADAVSALNADVSVLAIVDGDDRGIDATLYLDQNLGAELTERPPSKARRFLAGADFALVRDAVVNARRADPWRMLDSPPRVLCFMGGSDPTGAGVEIARSLASLATPHSLTVVAPHAHHDLIRAAAGGHPRLRLLLPTPDLPVLLAQADVVISAAGTSAWDLCVLGVPSVLVAVVENQRPSLQALVTRGLALTIDVVEQGTTGLNRIGELVSSLIGNEPLRRRMSVECRRTFDGTGAARVAEKMEAHATLGKAGEFVNADR